MLCVEFHCHSEYSPDSLTSPKALVDACRRKGIDRVVVTDHNTIAGALVARRLAPELVIVGEEIMTSAGEILAAYVRAEVPPGLSPEETIRKLREQGAFISVSHPFDTFRSGGWDPADLRRIVPLVDAIETFNARCMLPRFNIQAQNFARQHGLPGTVGSDAHASLELGRAVMFLEAFDDVSGLRQRLPAGIPRVRWSPPWYHLLSRYAVWRKRRKPALRP